MDNATFQRIKDLILKHQDVAVVVKPNPNLDEMAAGLGLYQVLLQMGKNAVIACPTDPVVAISSLVGINKVQKQLGTSAGDTGDLTVSFPYREGEIEKVSYNLENGLLNIVVKAGEKGLSFNQQDVQYKRSGSGTGPSLVFCVGIPHVSEVSGVFTPTAEQEVVNIDNHVENEKYGTTVVVDTKWSSVSEQIADFVTLLEPQIELDKDTAQNLLDGIDFATEDFTSPKTSYLAFEVAGILMKKGATRQKAQAQAQNVSQQSVATSQTMSQYIPPQQPPVQQAQPMQPQPAYEQPAMPAPMAVTQPASQLGGQQYSQPQPPVQQPAWQPPVQQAQPMQPQPMQSQPVQQPVNSGAPKQAPQDWLTPKVYKGSTIL